MSPRLRRRPSGPLRPEAPYLLLDVLRDGPAPLGGEGPRRAEAGALAVAVVIPPFRHGSGGHSTIADLIRGLEARGHSVSIWLHDDEGRHAGADPAAQFTDFFGPVTGPLHAGFDEWAGADVALATGWQTVPRVLGLRGAQARAYLVQDHEPEFYATSAERTWAEWTYSQGLHCICASPWLAGLVGDRYGATASSFDLGVDHDHYKALPTHRRDDLVLMYARAVTPRRAVPLGLLAMAELHRRRPSVEIALFGESTEIGTPFPHRHLGVLDPPKLAHAYASATVGVVLSLTNPSLVPTEMLACGLPVVDLASDSMCATFGKDGPIALTPPDPLAIAAAVESLLDDLAARADRSRAGAALAATRTWDAAAEQLEAGLREALARG